MPRCLTFWRPRTVSVLMNFSWNLDLRYYFKISYPIFLKRSYQINISMQIRGKFSLTFQWNMRCRLNSFFMRYVDCYNFEVAWQRWSVKAHKILWLPFKFTHTAKIDCIWTQLALVKTRDDIADIYFNKRSQIWANSLWMLIKDVLSVSNHLKFTFSVHFMIFAYFGARNDAANKLSGLLCWQLMICPSGNLSTEAVVNGLLSTRCHCRLWKCRSWTNDSPRIWNPVPCIATLLHVCVNVRIPRNSHELAILGENGRFVIITSDSTGSRA